MQDKRAQLEQEIDRLTTLMSSLVRYPVGTEERLEKALTELAVMNAGFAPDFVSATVANSKDDRQKVESKNQNDKMQDKKAELEQRRQRLNARSGFDLDTSGIDKELETINKELAAMDKSSAAKVGSAIVKPKDVQVKLESKGQSNSDKGKSEIKGKAEIKGSSGITSDLSEDLSETYKASMFLDERHIQKLARFEYAQLTKQSLSPSEGDFTIVTLYDQSLVESNPEALVGVNDQSIQDGITGAIGGKPTFLGVSNYRHWTIIALLPSGDNGEVSIYYINSAYGKGAEGYFGCKAVGLTLCQNIVNQVNSRPLKDKRVRPEVQADHLYLEPTQQIENNCGAVAGFNIGGIAAWHRAKKHNQTQDTLERYLGRLEYNQVLATRDTQSFEELVRARFIGIRMTGRDVILSSSTMEVAGTGTFTRSIMNATYYGAIQVQISQDKEAAEKMEREAIEGFDLIQQIALFEYYARLKNGLGNGKIGGDDPAEESDSKGRDDQDEIIRNSLLTVISPNIPVNIQGGINKYNIPLEIAKYILDRDSHVKAVLNLKGAIEGIDKLIAGKEYDKARAEIEKALQYCNRGINKGKYAADECELFIRLGDIYLHYGEIYDVPKAAAIYQYVKRLVEKHKDLTNHSEKIKAVEARIQSVATVFLERIKAPKLELKARELKGRDIALTAGTKEYIARLEEHREHVKKRLAEIENLGIVEGQEELDEEGLQKRASEVEAIYGITREFFIGQRSEGGELAKPGLINDLISDCIRELGGLPRVGPEKHECAYAIFGMGSMALGTMTPWSDLEFGILIEEGLAPEEEGVVKEYFRRLTVLLHIKVVNFGESPLRMMGIIELNNFKVTEKSDAEHNWFFDDLTRSGFSFDGPHWHACKTPLGRTKGYQKVRVKESSTELVQCLPYELIGTVREFTGFYQDTTWVVEDTQLVQGLGHITLISGQTSLISQYQDQLQEYDDFIMELASVMLKGDCVMLDPYRKVFKDEEEGQILNVKKEIYRFPDRIIVALGDCLGKAKSSTWRVIQELASQSKISTKGAANLMQALSISTELRLRTYANNNGQREDMSALVRYDSQIPELREELTSQVFYLKNVRLLYRYYYIVMPLASEIISAESIQTLQDNCQKQEFCQQDHKIRGHIYKRFLRYDMAIEEFESADNVYEVFGPLVLLYRRIGKHEKELYLLQKGLGHWANDQVFTATLFSAIGGALQGLGRHEEALVFHQRNLELSQKIYKGDHPYVAGALSNIGNTLQTLGKYEEALKYQLESLRMFRGADKNDSIDIATALNNVGNAYEMVGRYQEALESHLESLKMKSRVYKGDHPDLAVSIGNVGLAHQNLGKYVEALNYQLDALKMKQRIFKGDHLMVTTSLCNLGQVLECLGRYDEALIYLQQYYEMLCRIYKGDNVEIAAALNNLGHLYNSMEKYQEDLAYHQKNLEMLRRMHKGDHPSIAGALNNVGASLERVGRHDEALTLLQESVKMVKRIYKGDHPDVAISLTCLGIIFESLGRYDESLKCLRESLEMRRRIYKGIHPDIATTLAHMGQTLKNMGEFDESLKYNLESLEISQKVYKADHHHIAAKLNNIGLLLENLKRHKEALKYKHDSLAMNRRLYRSDKHEIAMSLVSIGNTLEDLKRYKWALKYKQEGLQMLRWLYKGDHRVVSVALDSMATTLESLDRNDEALKLLFESLEMVHRIHKEDHTDIVDSLQKIGITLGKLGRYAEALKYQLECLEMTRRVYKDHPLNIAIILSNIGNTLESLGRHEEALKYHLECLDLRGRTFRADNPALEDTLINLGSVLTKLGKHKMALKFIQESLEMKTRFDLTAAQLNQKGLAEFREKNYGMAIETFSRVIKFTQSLEEFRSKNYGKAMEACSSLVKFAQGLKGFRDNSGGNALAAFSRLIKSTPTAGYYYNRGRAYHEYGNYKEAIKDYREVLKIEPTHAKARDQLEKLTELEKQQHAATVIKRSWRKYVQDRKAANSDKKATISSVA